MRFCLLCCVLLTAGCQNVLGPFGYRSPQQVDDPNVPIEEQQRRGRERFAIPEDDASTPKIYSNRPGGPAR